MKRGNTADHDYGGLNVQNDVHTSHVLMRYLEEDQDRKIETKSNENSCNSLSQPEGPSTA